MDVENTKRFNRQIQRMYTLALFNLIIAVFGLVFNYYNFDINFSLFSIVLFVNFVALFFYQPWKIIGFLQKQREITMFNNAIKTIGENKNGIVK